MDRESRPRSSPSGGRRPALMAVGAMSLVLLPFLRSGEALPSADAAPGPGVESGVAAVVPEAPAEPSALDALDAVDALDLPAVVDLPARVVEDRSLQPLRTTDRVGDWRSARAPFALEVDDEPVQYAVRAVLAVPGQEVRIRMAGGAADATFRHGAGAARATGDEGWAWTAPPEPGIHAARVEAAGGAAVDLTMLVAHPADHVVGGALHGYAIGAYAKKPLRGLDAYLPPDRFVEVRQEDRDVLVSPHFSLGQFLCKQPGEPRFVSLSVPLLRKLEAVLQATNEAGIRAPTFHVMSGFRTPAYNRAIGNTTDYSRHLWGDAADVFVDVDGNGDMDDLNGDGRSTIADARLLAAIVDEVERTEAEGVRPGGLGSYRRNAAHGPFVHVDARGYQARW